MLLTRFDSGTFTKVVLTMFCFAVGPLSSAEIEIEVRAPRELCEYLLYGSPSLETYTQIPFKDLELGQRDPYMTKGRGTYDALPGRWQEHEVFIKISSVRKEAGKSLQNRTTADVLNEAYWLDHLSRKGWAPKLRGISYFTRITNSVTGGLIDHSFFTLITDFVPGRLVGFSEIDEGSLPRDFRPSAKSVAELHAFFGYMERNEIYPRDLQIMLSPDGTWKIIDPEWFQSIASLDEHQTRNYMLYFSMRKRRLIEYFEAQSR